jgi:hypothetical protein
MLFFNLINLCVIHLQAYLAYGIPNSSLKRMALFHKVRRFPEAVFSSPKIPKILQDSPSHQIFGRMHGALNVGKKNN